MNDPFPRSVRATRESTIEQTLHAAAPLLVGFTPGPRNKTFINRFSPSAADAQGRDAKLKLKSVSKKTERKKNKQKTDLNIKSLTPTPSEEPSTTPLSPAPKLSFDEPTEQPSDSGLSLKTRIREFFACEKDRVDAGNVNLELQVDVFLDQILSESLATDAPEILKHVDPCHLHRYFLNSMFSVNFVSRGVPLAALSSLMQLSWPVPLFGEFGSPEQFYRYLYTVIIAPSLDEHTTSQLDEAFDAIIPKSNESESQVERFVKICCERELAPCLVVRTQEELQEMPIFRLINAEVFANHLPHLTKAPIGLIRPKEVAAAKVSTNAPHTNPLLDFKSFMGVQTKNRKAVHKQSKAANRPVVVARIRPAGPKHASSGFPKLDVSDAGLLVLQGTPKDEAATYEFDRSFGPEATQEEVYTMFKGAVDEALEGRNATIFAYGASGSGKTWAMQGGPEPEQMGIIMRLGADLFSNIKPGVVIEVMVLDIYKKTTRDLSSLATVDLFMGAGTRPVEKRNASSIIVSTFPAFVTAVVTALNNRTTYATNANDNSSRSHLVVTVSVIDGTKTSVINIVDLAGCENSEASGDDRNRIIEASHINLGLLALRNFFLHRRDNGKSVFPWRETELMKILKDSLQGQAKVFVLVTVSPSSQQLSLTERALAFAGMVNNTPMKLTKV